MPGLIENDNYFNRVTHWIFPARHLGKDLIYWPCEIAAGILMFIYIVQMDVRGQVAQVGYSYSEFYETIKPTYYETVPERKFEWTYKDVKQNVPFGLTSSTTNYSFIEDSDTNLLNREYGWIMLCWAVKHFLYIVDCLLLMSLKLYKGKVNIKPIDLVTPIINCGIWTLWCIYAWTNSGIQIHAGMYERIQKDVLANRRYNTQDLIDERDAKINRIKDIYSENAGWTWLWIPTIAVFAINYALWIIGIIQKRSSLYTGQALSVQVIVLQLFFIHLFLKGSWIRSDFFWRGGVSANGIFGYYNTVHQDVFDARWIWWCIYLAAYAGLIFALVSFRKALNDFKYCWCYGLKWFSYGVFWVSGFIWILCMDNTLYHDAILYRRALVTTHIICFVAVFFIALCSIAEKWDEGLGYFDRHNRYAEWGLDSFTQTYPHFSQRMYAGAGYPMSSAPHQAAWTPVPAHALHPLKN